MDIASRRIRFEGERIRSELLRRSPALERRLVETSSGSFVISLAHGDAIEIGRLPHRGRASWVVVRRHRGRTSIRPCEGTEQVVSAALTGLHAVSAA